MTELRAYCKINLGLRVVRRRDDGFHDIETVMMPVRGLYDTVSVEALPTAATFVSLTPPPYPAPPGVFPSESVLEISGHVEVDCPPEQNICMRALRLVQREYGIGEASIALRKVVPTGAGLGGGSADAAAVLRALNEEFVLELTEVQLEGLAVQLGSDVPFFVRCDGMAYEGGNAQGGAQLCTGRGEAMSAVKVDLGGMWLVVTKPNTAVSTARAYAGVVPRESSRENDRESGREGRRGSYPAIGRGGRSPHPDAGLSLPEILWRPVGQWRELLHNDFEESVFALHPEIGALKQALYDAGAVYASMSGSGSAVFGIFERRPAIKKLPDSVFVHSEHLF